MLPKPRRVCAQLFLFFCLISLSRAEGLISVSVESITPAGAEQLTLEYPAGDLPTLDGDAAGLTPISHLKQNDAIWLLASDAAGQQVWLQYTDSTWLRKTPPPALIRPEIKPSSQAHVLALAQTEDGNLSLLTYHTITDGWANIGTNAVPGTIQSVRPAADGYLLTTIGSDGTESTAHLKIALSQRLLTWVDWLIIVVYLMASAATGLYFYFKDKRQSNADFFLAGRNIPWWAAGISLYATGTSAISYIAIPAKSFATNWLYFAANVIGLLGMVFTAIWVVPLIRRLNLMSVYHYLEMRFHPKIRVISSAIAIALQLGGRMSIVLFLPSLAISAVTGVNVIHSILIMGVVTILYTVLGGMKAVIWTDVVQLIAMLGGAFFAIGYVFNSTDGGISGFFQTALADDKFRTFDWSFDLTKATVWGFLLVVILGVLTYPQDQVMMQRVLSTKSDKEAGWSVWTLAAIVIPGSITFFSIGTALYVFYKQHPERLNPLLGTDSTFPQFIAAELPVGVTGLVIAGIFAASMSTLSSCINSVATLVSVDFYERYAKKPDPAKSVKIAEWMTFIAGVIGVGTAILLAMVDIKSALDKSFELTALLGGGFAGCYGLGMFTTRTNWQGAFFGVAASLIITFTAWIFKLVHPYFYIVIAISSCMIVGYIASYFFPAPKQSLLGLTVFTPHKKPVVLAGK